MTGKRLKGRVGGGAGYTVRTDDLMAEAGCLYHTSWIIDDQPWSINVRGGQKFIFARLLCFAQFVTDNWDELT